VIKWITAYRFRRDRPREANQRTWVEQHGRLAASLPGVKRYVQSHRVTGEQDIGNAPFDGFESLWFEDEATAIDAWSSPQSTKLRAGEHHFAEPIETKRFLALEVVMRDTPASDGALKLVTFNYRKPGLSPRAFQDYWENRHGPLVLQNFAALRRYVQNHALANSYEAGAEPDFDGVLEAWLASFEALSAGEGTPEHEATRADEVNFLDPARFRFMLVKDTSFA
jgi:uncharacterized protein (TIGR02118 family)